MRRILSILLIALFGVVTYILFGGSCSPKNTVAVDGLLFGKRLNTSVDDSLAGLMLTNPQDSGVLRLFALYEEQLLDTRTLSEITKLYSADVATVYFLQRLYQDENNKEVQDLYADYFERLSAGNVISDLDTLKKYMVVFVPGLAYKQDTTTGADFARQRRLLTSKGISNELIEVGEWDLADDNALVIASRLRQIGLKNRNVILVSASKGGLEAAIALGKILKPDETKSIKSWVNVGGIIRGSPIADNYLKFPKCWFAKVMLWRKDKGMSIVQDMSYKSRRESFKQLKFPSNIKIINFVGAPLATEVSKEIRSRYCSMIGLGPNDGLTPLADETVETGVTVSEIGLDHYYRDRNIDKKTLALALVAVEIQD